MFVEDAIDCAPTEVDTLLLKPVDDLPPTAIMVFPPDGEHSLLDVGVDLTLSRSLLGVLVILNELSQGTEPYPLEPAIDGGPVPPHSLGDDRYLNPGSMEFPC